MKQDIKQAWVNALRSGDYEQGRGALRQGDTYCCLGVLCDLAVKAGVIKQTEGPYDYVYGPTPYGSAAAFLPDTVIDWAGLDSHNPVITYGEDLAALNDDGCSFLQIATLIDEHL